MHKSLKHIALAGAAMALAMTPAMAGAQEQSNPETGKPTETGTPPSDTTTTTTTPPTTQDPAGTENGEDTTGTDTTTTSETTTPPANPDTTGTQAPPAAAATPMSQADRDAAVKTWPRETQAYYQSLNEERQRMFWALSDTDKVRLSKLPDTQKELAWTQIESQIKPPKG